MSKNGIPIRTSIKMVRCSQYLYTTYKNQIYYTHEYKGMFATLKTNILKRLKRMSARYVVGTQPGVKSVV